MLLSTLQPAGFVDTLAAVVGRKQVLSGEEPHAPTAAVSASAMGGRSRWYDPRSLVEQWRVLQACIAANKIVIMQAANTSLTGGATPYGSDYDRDVVIINTRALSRLYLIDEGRQVICLPGTTLYQLEDALRPLGREPHSVIGSSCFGHP